MALVNSTPLWPKSLDPCLVADDREHGCCGVLGWTALLEDVAGRLADDMGEQQRSRNAARAVYRQLGDELAAAEPAPEDDLAGRELAVHIELDGERLAVQTGDDFAESMDEGIALAAAIHEQDRRAAKSPLVHHLLEPLRDTGLLAPLMHIDGHLPADGDRPAEVRLTLDPPLLAQVPWELVPTDRGALATDPRIGVVYRVPNVVRAVGVQAMALQRALQRAGFSPGPVEGPGRPGHSRRGAGLPALGRPDRRRPRRAQHLGGSALAAGGAGHRPTAPRADLAPGGRRRAAHPAGVERRRARSRVAVPPGRLGRAGGHLVRARRARPLDRADCHRGTASCCASCSPATTSRTRWWRSGTSRPCWPRPGPRPGSWSC